MWAGSPLKMLLVIRWIIYRGDSPAGAWERKRSGGPRRVTSLGAGPSLQFVSPTTESLGHRFNQFIGWS